MSQYCMSPTEALHDITCYYTTPQLRDTTDYNSNTVHYMTLHDNTDHYSTQAITQQVRVVLHITTGHDTTLQTTKGHFR